MKKILSTLLCSTAFLSSFCLFGCSKKEPENPARIVSITQSGKVENVTTISTTQKTNTTIQNHTNTPINNIQPDSNNQNTNKIIIPCIIGVCILIIFIIAKKHKH